MKKNLVYILVCLILLIAFTGCQNSDNNKVEEGSNIESNETVDEDKIEDEDDLEELKDQELINDIFSKIEKKYMYKSVSEFSGNKFETVTYIDGNNIRIETDGAIIIYNAKDKATYQYQEGGSEGTVFYDKSDDVEKEIEPINEESFEALVKAEIVKLDGEDVLYAETKHIEEGEEDGLAVISKMWISTKYGIPIKTEVMQNDKVLSVTEVKEISEEYDSDKMFSKPENIKFEELSSESGI